MRRLNLRTKVGIQNSDFFVPVTVRTDLALREHESFPRVKAPIGILESTLLSCDLEQPVHAQQQRCGSARLEDHLMWPHEHGRFAETTESRVSGSKVCRQRAL